MQTRKKKSDTIAIVLPFASLVSTLFVLSVNSVSTLAAQLTQWNFDQQTQRLELTLPGGTTPQYFLLAQPPRIVIDLPNTQIGQVPEVQTYSGVVRSIRVGQFQPELTRIVMELEPNAVFSPGHIEIQPTTSSPTTRENGLEQWRIRPLIVGYEQPSLLQETIPATSSTAQSTTLPSASSTSPITTASTISPSLELNPNVLPQAGPTELILNSPSPLAASNTGVSEELEPDLLTDSLPPLEPGALELPIELLEPTLDLSHTASRSDLPPPTIEFGQQLRGEAESPESVLGVPLISNESPSPENPETSLVSIASGIDNVNESAPVIPRGTVVTLRYPRSIIFSLDRANARQEVLVTTHSIRDRTGSILIPGGSLVIGRFESVGRTSLRFVAQALQVGDRTIPLTQAIAELPNTVSINPNQLIELQIDQAIEIGAASLLAL